MSPLSIAPLDDIEAAQRFAGAPELQEELSFEEREILKRRLEELCLGDESLSTYYDVLIPLLLRQITGRPPGAKPRGERAVGHLAIDLDPLITRYVNFPRRVSESMNAIVLRLAEELSAQTTASDRPRLKRRRRVQSGHVQMMHSLLRLLDRTLATALPQKRFRGTNIEYLLEGDVILRPQIGALRGPHIVVRRDTFLDPFGSPSHLIEAREVGIDRESSARALGIPLREGSDDELGALYVEGPEAEALKGSPFFADATSDAIERLFRRFEVAPEDVPSVIEEPASPPRPPSPEEDAREELVLGDVQYLLESVWLVANTKRRTRATESQVAEIDPLFHDHLAVAFQLMCQEANLRSRLVEAVLVRDRGHRTPTLLVEVDCEQPGALPFEAGRMILVDPLILDDDGEPKRYIHRRAAFVACDPDVRSHLGDRAWCKGIHGVYALPVVGAGEDQASSVDINAVGRCFPFGFARDISNRPSGEIPPAEAELFQGEPPALSRVTAKCATPSLPPTTRGAASGVSDEPSPGSVSGVERPAAHPSPKPRSPRDPHSLSSDLDDMTRPRRRKIR